MEPVTQAGGDPEVAATAAERPEQVLMLRFGRRHQLAIGGDEFNRQQVVDRHPVLAHQPAEPTGERQPGDADSGDVAARRRQAGSVRPCVVLPPGQATFAEATRRSGSTSSPFIGERSSTSPSSIVP